MPEFLQHDIKVDDLVSALEERLFQDQTALLSRFEQIHHELKQNADEKSAQAVIALMNG